MAKKHSISIEDITLDMAMERIAAEFDNPYLNQHGQTVNAWGWTQRRVLQGMANNIWADLYDTRSFVSNGRKMIKGLAHRIDNQVSYLKKLGETCDLGNEIDAGNILRASAFLESMQEQFAVMEDAYNTIANVYERAVGEPLAPYEPWQQWQSHSKEQASSETASAAREALRRAGIVPKEDAPVLNTDGVNTPDAA